MDIKKEQIDDLNAVISLKVEENDYQERVDKVLRDYRKTASIKGFRPGNVPMGMIKKLYYKPVLVEEINKLVSEKLMGYINEEKMDILGEPLPHEDSQIPDFDNDKEFSFQFDLGISPEFKSEVTEKDKITFYKLKVEKKVVEEQIEEIAKRFGELKPVEKAGSDELIKGSVYELEENGERKENGLVVDEVSMSLDMMKDDKQKKAFLNKKSGDTIAFDIRKAYPNDTEIAAMLKVEKEKLEGISSKFEVEIKEVLKFEKHEVNQELFDKAYGEGNVKSEDEFREKIKEELKVNYERESNYKFAIDAKDYFIKKAKITLPETFLKRWLVAVNEDLTSEKIDEDFKNYEDEFRWQLVKNQLVKAYEISVSDEELFEYAFIMARNQFYQYGLYNVPEEHIENYAKEQLAKPEEARRLREQKYDDKIIGFIKETVKLDEKEITTDKFRKLFEN